MNVHEELLDIKLSTLAKKVYYQVSFDVPDSKGRYINNNEVLEILMTADMVNAQEYPADSRITEKYNYDADLN